MLTAAAAILAMIPLTRSVFWGPMAVAIMGGLIVATLLTCSSCQRSMRPGIASSRATATAGGPRKQLNDGSKARSAPAQRLLGRRMAFA
jgi:hypothetical protein